MTKANKPTPKKTIDTSAVQTANPAANLASNPFLDNDFYGRMRDYTERDAAIAKELRAIAECGAGKANPDPRFAPSLEAISAIVKKGVPLAAMLKSIVAGTEKALWEPWLGEFGIQLRAVNYGPTGPRNACLLLDIGAGSKANAAFAKVSMPNWRSRVAQDCAEVAIENPNDKTAFTSCAIFYLDR
jgi:hypothetical protein